ncbi:hypothetical protein [Streptomyces siamensis]|uniref:hypothetical protein n=1 Tax=Streptomyces siamensis TaxID=1274986 RepID=UPI0031EA8793
MVPTACLPDGDRSVVVDGVAGSFVDERAWADLAGHFRCTSDGDGWTDCGEIHTQQGDPATVTVTSLSSTSTARQSRPP